MITGRKFGLAPGLVLMMVVTGCSVSTHGRASVTPTTLANAAPTTSTSASTAPTTAPASTSSTTTSPVQPTLGSAAALEMYISGTGFGQVKPSMVSLGGDPTGIVSQISWQSWGGSQAVGVGTSTWVADGQTVAQGSQESVQIVAFRLGTCEGQYMYQSVEWIFPQHQQTFLPTRGMDVCDPAAPSLEHPTSGVGFFSPTHSISCQVLDGPPYPKTEVYCQTGSPAASVTLQADGTFQPCHGISCLGNPATGTPVLAYGHVITLGPFRCDSEPDGVTCTAAGKGFQISRSGIVAA